ncbi:hypothetical protein D3C86_1904740 [compost metagenome]
MNGIIQPPGFPDDRNAAVTQGQELADSARLEFGRHEEQVAGRINFAGQRVTEQNLRRKLGRVTPLGFTEPAFIDFISGPQQDKLNIIIIQQLIQHACQQIQTFGIHQTRNHSDHRNIRCNRQPKLLL